MHFLGRLQGFCWFFSDSQTVLYCAVHDCISDLHHRGDAKLYRE